MRRASYTPAFKVSVDEPLIVVDESEELDNTPTSPKSIEDAADDDKESPDNPYLLSPWRDPRDTRKHSLPNLQCTDGITASQVRRLSDGGDNSPNVNEVAFLAKLSQVQNPISCVVCIVTVTHFGFGWFCNIIASFLFTVSALSCHIGFYIVGSTTFGGYHISCTANIIWP